MYLAAVATDVRVAHIIRQNDDNVRRCVTGGCECAYCRNNGKQDKTLSSVGIKEADTPEFARVVSLAFVSAQPNRLITAQTAGFVDRTRLTSAESHIAFCSYDKIGIGSFDSKESGKVQESTVEYVDASSFKKHPIHEVNVMNRSVCNLYEYKDRSSQVDLSVKLDRGFGFSEISPWKHRQAQIYRG